MQIERLLIIASNENKYVAYKNEVVYIFKCYNRSRLSGISWYLNYITLQKREFYNDVHGQI